MLETKRQLDVLDRCLAEHEFLIGDAYTIADIACFPWYGGLVLDQAYDGAARFLSAHEYVHVSRWATRIAGRPAVQRGRRVNRPGDDGTGGVRERHGPGDLDPPRSGP